jgi:serine/threonine-protein kinase
MGSYQLVERLGSGGMGEVWRAEHRMLVRPAAIKLIRPEVLGATSLDGQHVVRRFEREAQATALLRSAHTVELYDFGRADDGTFYYVMELLDGFDLNELVEQFGPVPPERALHFLRQICASLAEAHEAGLVHRDIKPANMYTCRHGREVDFVKVLDFGLVKHGATAAEGNDRLSAENLGAGGTPAFMSPEQATGDEQLDGRADLYAVGCVAYWLLTGTTVFSGRTPVETMMMHVHQRPDPPSSRTGSAIPRDLEVIVLACLAKDPEARPQSADELAERLATVRLAREWTPARAREWWDAHRPPATDRYPRPRAWDSNG